MHLQWGKPGFASWVRKIPWRRDRLPTPVFLGFPCGSAGKESTPNAGDLCLISGLGRSPGEGKGYPLQYSDLENSIDYTVHGVTKSRTRLSDFHFPFLWTSINGVPFYLNNNNKKVPSLEDKLYGCSFLIEIFNFCYWWQKFQMLTGYLRNLQSNPKHSKNEQTEYKCNTSWVKYWLFTFVVI